MRDRIEEAIARHRGRCDYIEVRLETSERTSVAVRDREVDGVVRSRDGGGCCRAAYKGGWGFVSFNDTDGLDRWVAEAVSQARQLGTESTRLAPVPPVVAHLPSGAVTHPASAPLTDKIALLQGYAGIVLEFGNEIKSARASYGDNCFTRVFANSEGSFIEREGIDLWLGVTAIARTAETTQTSSVSRGSTSDYGVVLDLEGEVREAARLACDLARAPKVTGGAYTVICDPHLAGIFVHESFGHMSEADDLLDNPRSLEVMPLGRKVGSDILTIYDTGQDVGCRGYVPFDDEGVPGERADLIRDGILVGHLHTRQTAALLGEKPTGNARALDYRHPPICRMRNTCIARGEHDFESMLEGVALGLYAGEGFGGAAGETFSFAAGWGRMIRDGRLAELVRDVKLIGNLFETLQRIDRIGHDFQIPDSGGGCGKNEQFPLPVTHSSPHIRIQEVTVGGQ